MKRMGGMRGMRGMRGAEKNKEDKGERRERKDGERFGMLTTRRNSSKMTGAFTDTSKA